MLAMLPQQFRQIPIAQLFPWDENDVAVAMSDQVIIVLKNIRTDTGQRLCIRRILEEDTETFGKQSFNERLTEFGSLLFCFLERKFVTKKQDYLFFDDIEQKKIKELFSLAAFHAECEIYVINKDTRKARKIVIENLSLIGWTRLKPYVTKLGCVFVFGADEGFKMMAAKRSVANGAARMWQRPRNREDKELKKFFEEFPDLAGHTTRQGYNESYKKLCKEYHPDVGGDVDKFQRLQEANAYIEKTAYFKTLKEG